MDEKTEKQILLAAKDIFLKKGKSGARMQEIADKAGVNKALLHYYYRSKDKIYSAVLDDVFSDFIGTVLQEFNVELPFDEMLENFIKNHIKVINENNEIFQFFFSEIWMNTEEIIPLMKKNIKYKGLPAHIAFMKRFKEAIKAKEIRKMDPVHFLINILSLDIFFFIASPMIFNIIDIPGPIRKKITADRPEEVFRFVWESVRYREEGETT